MTYSIVARDPVTGEIGVGVQTHQPAVGAVVPWVAAGVGAVATQSFSNIEFGPDGLALLRNGRSAEQTLAALLATDEGRERRQVAVIAREGAPAVFTGSKCLAHAGHRVGADYSVQANMMLNESVPSAMATAFEAAQGLLAVRILAALEAAQAEGGDMRGMQSAAILVRYPGPSPIPIWDLRSDNSPTPLADLRGLVEIRLADIALHPGWPGAGPQSLDEFRSALVAAIPHAPTDEQLLWFAVDMARADGGTPEALDLLRPILARNPGWWLLLERAGVPAALVESLRGAG